MLAPESCWACLDIVLNCTSTTHGTGTMQLTPGRNMTKKFNTSGRLFTFGASETRYHWPTYADIIGTCWKEFENWGKSGAGNQYIFNSIIECDARNNFNENDTILVLWAPPPRIDYYQYNDWGTVHHKFPIKDQPDYPASCSRGYEIITYAYIQAIDVFLKSKKVEFKMWKPYGPTSEITEFYSSVFADLEKLKFRTKESMKSTPRALFNSSVFLALFEDTVNDLQKKLYKKLSGPSWPPLEDILNNSYTATSAIQLEIDEFLKILENDKKIKALEFKNDSHPGPLGYLELIQSSDYLKDLPIPDATIQWVTEVEQKLRSGEKINFTPKIPKHRL